MFVRLLFVRRNAGHNHFKAFLLLRTLQLIDWISLGAKSSEMHNKVHNKLRWGYPYNLFPASKEWTQDQLSIGRHRHKDLIWTESGLGPIQTCLEKNFWASWSKPKWKLTQNLLLLCAVRLLLGSLKRHLAAISGDNQCRGTPVDKIRNFEEKSFSKIIITPLPRPRPDLCECVTSMNFQELLVFFVGGGVPNWKFDSDFFVFKKSFLLHHHGDLWSTRKFFVWSKCITAKVFWIKPFMSGLWP